MIENLFYYYYGISVVVSLAIGILFRLPIKVNSDSFEGNALFPTVFIALGLTAIVDHLFSLSISSCIGVGVFSALLSKYVNKVFPGVEYGN
jgi:energy-converting hydrogenase A subunit A